MAPGRLAGELPGCSGTRNLSDNLSDLKAQVRAVWVCIGVGEGWGGGGGRLDMAGRRWTLLGLAAQ